MTWGRKGKKKNYTHPSKHIFWAEELGDCLRVRVERQRYRLAGNVVVVVPARVPKHRDGVLLDLAATERHS